MARSIYLQGLILQNEKQWPKWIKERQRQKHRELLSWLNEMKLTPMQGVIEFLKSIDEIHTIVIGICSEEELKEFKYYWELPYLGVFKEHHKWASKDLEFIDPRNWKQYQ